MDKYLQLQCVKGLLLSLDDQLYQRFQKYGDDEKLSVKKVIVDKYYDAIKEQLNEPEKANEDHAVDSCVITVNDVKHDFYEQTISWEQVIALTNLALTGNELLTIAYIHDNKSTILEVNDVIPIQDKMVFNVEKTTGA